MAIKKYVSDKLVGSSTDVKPLNIPDGATFYETDTLQIYLKISGAWVATNIGYTGSIGNLGYTGSIGAGYTGSASTQEGYTGSVGYTGSMGSGYDGSIGETGYTGSIGYTGSTGAGYDGSIGETGYTGSVGYSGSIGYSGSQGALLPWTVKTSNYNLSDGDRIIVNSSGGSFSLLLPSPVTGAYLQISDGGNLFTNPVTVLKNGATIEGINDDVLLTIPNTTYEFIYDGTTWQITLTSGPKGYTGSIGNLGYTGSVGDVGYTGSASTQEGYTGSIGYTGSTGAGLAASDWTQLPNGPLDATQVAAWASYRQSLRDITNQPNPFSIVWPVSPAPA